MILSLNIDDNMEKQNEILSTTQAKALGGLTLAFYGDSVYEVLVRSKIVKCGTMPVNKLHQAAVKKVNAIFQSKAFDEIEDKLTEEELEIYKRGRNATGNNVPRSASSKDYRKATGIEALFGFLHLTGQLERMNELFELIYVLE